MWERESHGKKTAPVSALGSTLIDRGYLLSTRENVADSCTLHSTNYQCKDEGHFNDGIFSFIIMHQKRKFVLECSIYVSPWQC